MRINNATPHRPHLQLLLVNDPDCDQDIAVVNLLIKRQVHLIQSQPFRSRKKPSQNCLHSLVTPMPAMPFNAALLVGLLLPALNVCKQCIIKPIDQL
jgi:hypothetical protein